MDLKKVFYVKLFVSAFGASVSAEQCSEVFNSRFTPYSRSTEMFFKKQDTLKSGLEQLETIKETDESSSDHSIFCFRDTKQAEEILGTSQHNKALLLKEIYENSRRKAEKRNKLKKIKNIQALRKELFNLRMNCTKMYVFNKNSDEITSFDISYMTDREIEMCIRNAFQHKTSSQEVSSNSKKLIKISDILNILFREFLDTDDCFLQEPITICGKNGYFSKEAFNFLKTE